MVVVYFSRFIYKRNALLLFYCLRNCIPSNIYGIQTNNYGTSRNRSLNSNTTDVASGAGTDNQHRFLLGFVLLEFYFRCNVL
jgi:hypothetical protein